MTAPEDRLRSQLRDAAATMPVGSGSLAGVQARAAQLQRRRNAARGGVGALALVAVALVGFTSLRDGGIDDFADSVETEAASDTVVVPAAAEAMSVERADTDEMADEAGFAAADESPAGTESVDDVTAGAVSQDSDDEAESQQQMSEESEEPESDSPASGGGDGAVFAQAVSAVSPPAEAEGTAMRYSFSGAHAVAQADDEWYAYDGTEWQTVGIPDDIEVVAVDLSGPERIAIVGVVRPLECAVEHVVGVKTSDGWGFARIDDGTPPMVRSELLHARVRLTDRAVEVDRTERLWLDEDCADPSEYDELTGDAAELAAELVELGEIQRQSWLVASFEPDFVTHWPSVASDDAHGAVAQRSELSWAPVSNPLYTVAARELTPARSPEDEALSVELHRTTMLELDTTVEVSAGMALLKHGDQSWEVCPIPDVEQANGEVGWAGEHLAVVVGKPEQTLFVIQRAE